jgi:hypothetical protein
MFSGGDNGTLTMWDYATGLPFQNFKDIPQPGSLDAEAVSALLEIESADIAGCILLCFRQDWNEVDHGWRGQDDQGVL